MEKIPWNNGQEVWKWVVEENLSFWSLISSENFHVSYAEAKAMNELEFAEACAALDYITKERKKAQKKSNSKKK